MRSSRVIPQEPVHKRLVESGEVIGKEVAAACNECFRKGSVEPLNFCLHLGRTRVGVEVNDAPLV